MRNEIIFNSVIFGFMVNGEAVGVEFHAEGKGKIGVQTYGMIYNVNIKYKGILYTFRTSHFANKSNAKNFIKSIINESK